ncbi:DUF3149 domain-containing protein [Chitinimonas sp.]|uniref:DUF3149 domain-containing protein n=1 Tax=Chitinimonas sp. TaxID=1934313 RepID=UPI002F948C0D
MNVALTDLFTTDIGILSLMTIGFIIGMATYIFIFVRRHVLDAEAAEARRVANKQ